ncbi:MAG: glycoside hydrolase family 38 C-terminal domain-containing protein [Pseudomonadota bacterium]
MTHARRFTAEKIGKRVALLQAMLHRDTRPLDPFRVRWLPDAAADPPLGRALADWPEIPWNSYWAGQNRNFLLATEFTIPRLWGRGPVGLHLPLGVAGDIFTHPEATLFIDGQAFASADRYHHTIYLPERVIDGRSHRLELHGWTGLTGWPPNPDEATQLFMRPCAVVEIDVATRDFLSLAEVTLEAALHLADAHPARHRMLTALDDAFLKLDTRDPLGELFYRTVPAAMAALEAGLAEAGAPLDVTLHAVGHAHIDVAYLWPVLQTRRKNARTTLNVLRLMERFPSYRFSHSQPALYKMTEVDYPDVFDGIRARVAEGRWEPIGGMWVEPDTNIPGPEALVRQILLGRRYFAEKFGRAAEAPVLWIPDTFGMSWCLPQLMAQSGLKWMVTNKVNWNQYNQVPASTTWWEGIDGTRVLAHFLTTPREVQHLPFPTNYKSDLSAEEVIGTWEKSTAKERIDELPICYGYGDGGGGPTGPLIRRAEIWANMPGAPRVKFSSVRAFFEAIEPKAADLPVWADELYLEGHRGVLTSQAWIKRANRHAEAALHEVEYLAARAFVLGGQDLPWDKLTEAWEILCLNQFHDIVTGTSIPEVFEDARRDYARLHALVGEMRAAATGEGTDGFGVVNATPFPITRQAVIPPDAAATLPAEAVTQTVEGGTLIEVGPLAPYSVTPLRSDRPVGEASAARLPNGGIRLENDVLTLDFDTDATLTRIFDKRAAREVLKDGQAGNRLQVFEDRPISWDAWDIDAFFEDRGEVVGGLTRFEIVEAGPLRAAIWIERAYRSSRITQQIRLCAASPRIDFVTDVDWQETHLLLKVAFPVAVFSPVATYEIQWGSIMRPTHRNTSWDYAKFEVPAQRWADLSEADYGVALLNDCKYGYDVHKDVLRLSLIKSATMPDPTADRGPHRFTYALLPHLGDWRRGEVIKQAWSLNAPAVAERSFRTALGGKPLVSSPAPNVVIETVKVAEDRAGLVIRLFEANRARGPVEIRFSRPLAEARRCTLLEVPEGPPLAVDGTTLPLTLRPFEIVSLRVRFQE